MLYLQNVQLFLYIIELVMAIHFLPHFMIAVMQWNMYGKMLKFKYR